ncbi:MAG TPA: 2-polyprenyl-6-methoxyphenol hydroxylase-like oxidoreductase [Mycobacterium sp.]|nr:2-polyprenyl-6-methoxyphenol hydroxylase-like oxidoreductase [Mycobacterium sp.]
MAALGDRAVVLGASMGGLLAARVLADFFETVTVVERDVLPDDDDAVVRRGVPQGRHVHVLLARGAQILEELFPGFLKELVADGAPVWDDGELSKLHLSFGGHDILRSGKVAKDPKALAIHMPSRPFLDCHVRRRLRAISNVTILSGHEVAEVTTTPNRRRVTGVRVVDHDGAERELTADVVMDAMGRGAHTPALLERLGYGRPVEDHIVMHTNYVSQLLRIPHGSLTEMLVDIGPAPDRPAGMFLSGYENDTWMFTVFGMAGHQPPRDLTGMLSFAQEYCPEHLIAAMRAAEPVGEVAHHHMPSSQWRRYDKMLDLPDGLLVCGDAICSVNPIYGQGMTLAALEAAALRECLRGGGDDLPRRYLRAAAKPIGVAWQMVASSDLAFPEVAGRRSTWMRIATRLVDRALAASESDLVVAVRFFRVNSLIDSPIRLLHPVFLYRVAAVNLRRRRGDGGSRQAEMAGRAC